VSALVRWEEVNGTAFLSEQSYGAAGVWRNPSHVLLDAGARAEAGRVGRGRPRANCGGHVDGATGDQVPDARRGSCGGEGWVIDDGYAAVDVVRVAFGFAAYGGMFSLEHVALEGGECIVWVVGCGETEDVRQCGLGRMYRCVRGTRRLWGPVASVRTRCAAGKGS
jgi:hypothetical protein